MCLHISVHSRTIVPGRTLSRGSRVTLHGAMVLLAHFQNLSFGFSFLFLSKNILEGACPQKEEMGEEGGWCESVVWPSVSAFAFGDLEVGGARSTAPRHAGALNTYFSVGSSQQYRRLKSFPELLTAGGSEEVTLGVNMHLCVCIGAHGCQVNVCVHTQMYVAEGG